MRTCPPGDQIRHNEYRRGSSPWLGHFLGGQRVNQSPGTAGRDGVPPPALTLRRRPRPPPAWSSRRSPYLSSLFPAEPQNQASEPGVGPPWRRGEGRGSGGSQEPGAGGAGGARVSGGGSREQLSGACSGERSQSWGGSGPGAASPPSSSRPRSLPSAFVPHAWARRPPFPLPGPVDPRLPRPAQPSRPPRSSPPRHAHPTFPCAPGLPQVTSPPPPPRRAIPAVAGPSQQPTLWRCGPRPAPCPSPAALSSPQRAPPGGLLLPAQGPLHAGPRRGWRPSLLPLFWAWFLERGEGESPRALGKERVPTGPAPSPATGTRRGKGTGLTCPARLPVFTPPTFASLWRFLGPRPPQPYLDCPRS
uniref:translation initiation factor IF-2-like n=1 Tax=Ictidomys tridecemlineatus TaxID=43179 RepID=UPI001AA007A5|nr:translation initiation factor IF-2-like [Ictidomys tridecemlineatus]